MNNAAPDGGNTIAVNGVYTQAYLPSDFASKSASSFDNYNSTLGLFYDTSSDRNGNTTNTYKDAEGRTVRTKYDDGSFSETLYSVGNTPVSEDQEGNAIDTPSGLSINGGSETVTIAQHKASEASPAITFKLYDPSQRLTNVWTPPVLDMDPNSPTYSPDHNNAPVSAHWQYVYDTVGNETQQIGPNIAAQLQAWTSPGHAAADFNGITAFAYDQNGNQVKQTLPTILRNGTIVNPTESWTYNASGQVTGHTDFNGNTAAYTYLTNGDVNAGMLQQVVYAAPTGSSEPSQIVTYGYDTLGRQASVSDASGTTTNTYDGWGNLITAATPQGTIHYVFDPATGNHTYTFTTASPASTDITTQTQYGYDPQDRLTTVTVKTLNGATLPQYLVTHYTYDAVGNKLSETLPSGEVTTYTYDDLNRQTDLLAQQGSTTLFSQHFTLNGNDTRASVTEPRGTTTSTYDGENRLTGESFTGNDSSQSYSDTFSYDLNNNRVEKHNAGPGISSNETIHYYYNANDELTSSHSSLTDDTDYTYDANGSLTGVTNSTTSQNDRYGYGVRNKMTSATVSGTASTYVYDDAGNRVQETVGSTTTTYLTDSQNPTGYAQPLEEMIGGATSPNRTYLIGDHVFGQANGGGTARYLLTDGRGSTRLITNGDGTVTKTVNYDAFGGAIGLTPGSAGTEFLFGGDAVYDGTNGLYLHGNGERPRIGSQFLQRDRFPGLADDPQSLHKYTYAESDPTDGSDPTGFLVAELGIGEDIEAGEGAAAESAMNSAQSFLMPLIDNYNAILGGYMNMALASPDESMAGAFAVGYISAYTQSYLHNDLGLPCWLAGGVGGAMQQAGNDVLAGHGGIGDVIEAAVISGVLSYALQGGCFVAGTPVLLGDGKTEQSIDTIHVGERVATDGGVANSADGKTKAADPNATSVDPKTWREITVTSGNWKVQALEPMEWLRSHHVHAGGSVELASMVDVKEMGAPAGLASTVCDVSACPTIQGGAGRVVLTTVTHLNDDVYHLTLTDAAGKIERLGVTGYHRFYDESTGWVHVQELRAGEVLRGEHGNVKVTSVVRDPQADRVYNVTVDKDHVYYVGDFATLTHNSCGDNSRELTRNIERDLNLVKPSGFDAAHVVPSWDDAVGAVKEMQEILEEVGIGRNDSENGFFTADPAHNGTHSPEFIRDLYRQLLGARGSNQAVADVLESAIDAALNGHWT